MSLRARVVIVSVLALVNFASFATAPQLVDPGQDLAEPRPFAEPGPFKGVIPRPAERPPSQNVPAKPDQAAAPEPDAALVQPSATPADMPAPPANPLWAIPLSRLTATRERPIFSAARRPPAVVIVKPVASNLPAPKHLEPEKPTLSLIGTIVGIGAGAGIGLFVDAADQRSAVSLKAGDNHKGWILRSVGRRQVELAKGLDVVVLDLPRPDMKSATALPARMPSPSPVVAMPTSPASASLRADGAGVAGSLPVGAGGHAPVTVKPPVFDPPPSLVNPFRNGRLP
jgi:hypothetical protein